MILGMDFKKTNGSKFAAWYFLNTDTEFSVDINTSLDRAKSSVTIPVRTACQIRVTVLHVLLGASYTPQDRVGMKSETKCAYKYNSEIRLQKNKTAASVSLFQESSTYVYTCHHIFVWVCKVANRNEKDTTASTFKKHPTSTCKHS